MNIVSDREGESMHSSPGRASAVLCCGLSIVGLCTVSTPWPRWGYVQAELEEVRERLYGSFFLKNVSRMSPSGKTRIWANPNDNKRSKHDHFMPQFPVERLLRGQAIRKDIHYSEKSGITKEQQWDGVRSHVNERLQRLNVPVK